MGLLPSEVSARLARLLGEEVRDSTVATGGYTPAKRWVVTLCSGRRIFAKMGTTTMTAEALRLEWSIYERLRGPFMPEALGWDDDPERPLLVLEDLSGARWPPPWDQALVDEVQEALESLHSSELPIRSFVDVHRELGNGWEQVAADPEAFLGLGVVSREWLASALPALVSASGALDASGTDVMHLDVRSDNLCRSSRGVLLVDWNCVCQGNGAVDTGFWLPSLEAEGGPQPEEVLPHRPEIAAWVSGFFAARAGLPSVPDAPRVRSVQLEQLRPALRWVARQLGLPAPTTSG